MNCCPFCFHEKQYTIISLIQELSEESGDCDICGTEEAEIVDNKEIADFFVPLFDIYEIKPGAEKDNTLIHELQNKWNIFSKETRPNISKLLQNVVDQLDNSSYFDLFNATHVQFNFIEQNEFENEWDQLKTEIKEKNRFFFRAFKPDELEEILMKNEVIYRQGRDFYRARLCNSKEGLEKNKMGKPPREKATAGRANPSGIPYLYLSLDEQTVIHEVRAFHYDYVTIARFKADQDLKILSLTAPDLYENDPFMEGILRKTLSAIQFLETLEQELAKPLRRNDSILEYLPTQYICELAKNLGFDGIEYSSTLYPGGTNIAVFHDEKLSIDELTVVEIKNVTVESEEIQSDR